MTPYVIAVIVLACLGAGLWLYRRGRDREKLKIVTAAVEANQRREKVNATVARMDAAERGAELKRWMRDKGD